MSNENPFQIPNEYSYLEYLSDTELDTLNKLSKVSNNINKKESESKRLENMTINDFYNQWAKTHVNILQDLSKLSSNDYKKHFTDIDKTEEWWKGIMIVSKDLYNIFTKDSRIIYTGITIIFISIMIFFISSSR